MKLSWERSNANAFERFGLEMLRHRFRIRPHVAQTRAVKDDGYDGVIVVPIADSPDIAVKGLFEAKLRGKKQVVGVEIVRAVVGSLLYTRAHFGIVMTNRHFTAEAWSVAGRTNKESLIQVRLVDGGHIGEWLDSGRWRGSRDLRTFVGELRSRLTRRPRRPKEGEILVDDHVTPAVPAEPPALVAKPPQVHSDRDGHLVALVTSRQRSVVVAAATIAAATPGLALIDGVIGSGKTVFLQHLTHTLRENGIYASDIRVASIEGKRQLFLELARALTGIDHRHILGIQQLQPLIRRFLDGSRRRRADVVESIVNALSMSATAFAIAGVDEHALAQYLAILATEAANRRRHVVLFADVATGTKELLFFLQIAARNLIENGVTVIIELPAAAEGANAGPIRELVRHYEQAPVIWRETLTNLNTEDAIELLAHLRPDLRADFMWKIVDRFGGNPHCLNSVANFVSGEGDDLLKDSAVCSDVLDHLATTAENGGVPDFAICAIAVDLLGGSLNRAEFRTLPTTSDFTTVTEALIRTTLFRRSGDGGVEYDHALARQELSRRYRQHPQRNLVAGQLLKAQTRRIDRVRLELLYAAESWADVFRAALRVSAEAVSRRDWTRAEHALSLAASAAPRAQQPSDRLGYRVATYAADVHTLRYSLGVGAAPSATELQTMALAYSDDVFADLPERGELRPLGCLSLWRNAFYRENFEEAEKWARVACLAVEPKTSAETSAAVHIAYAVTLHATSRRSQALDYLRSLSVKDTQYLVESERLSIEAAGELDENPERAESLYRAALDNVEKADPSSIHVVRRRVDVAIAQFACGRWIDSERSARSARDAAHENMLPVERGRGTNVLAASLWVQGRTTDALDQWRRLFDHQRTNDLSDWTSRRVEWRYLTNYATATKKLNPAGALQYARRAEDLILNARPNAMYMPDNRRSSWYAALLAIATVYHELGYDEYARSLEQTMGAQFMVDVITIRDRALPEGVAGAAAFKASQTLMITG